MSEEKANEVAPAQTVGAPESKPQEPVAPQTAPAEAEKPVEAKPIASAQVVVPELPNKAEKEAPVPPTPAPEAKKEEVPSTTVTPKETVAPKAASSNLTSGDILKPAVDKNNVFMARRAQNAVDTKHTALGRKVIVLLDEYVKRMSTPSNDRAENIARIRMLQNIVNVACPSSATDMQTATDVVRIVFDCINKNWGTVFTDANIFRMGDLLKATKQEADKITMFITAFTQMIEGAREKKRVLFDNNRLGKTIRNMTVATVMGRIRDNINTRNGF